MSRRQVLAYVASCNCMLHFMQEQSAGLVLRLGFITCRLCDMEEDTCPIELGFSIYPMGIRTVGLYLLLLQMTYYVQK